MHVLSLTKRFCVILACIALFSGCGSGNKHTLAKVTGKVTQAGKPVAKASVFFQPIGGDVGNSAGQGSIGVTDDNGNYELKTFRNQEAGAIVGRHRVTVNLPNANASDEGESSTATNMSPLPFRDGSLQIEVPTEGLTTADFDLANKS